MGGFHGVVETDLGPAFVDGTAPPSGHDMDELRKFQRFLSVSGPPNSGRVMHGAQGWVLYVLGIGPEPPEGMDDVPPSAWTLPA